ncbi:MAG: UvrD-helicase domain-containing protein, partial [Lachnospiraceae bacterium]|nr:UvrD-helicase domain-containing protein [Lachnospiraceae bacterium]
MGMSWTDAQRRVIELRDKNILVSAAAGSGKTAVLVERIIQKILDKTNPTDIDRFLIVTFTNAAAGEMRERISDAIERELDNNPSDENLIRQSVLVHKASICTIDSFCLGIVKNEFNKIDIDPGFRLANNEEKKMIETDVLDEVLRDSYENADEDFLYMVECLTPGRSDDKLKQYIMDLYDSAMSQPWPKKWINGEAQAFYNVKSLDDMLKSPWVYMYKKLIKSSISETLALEEKCVRLAENPGLEFLRKQAEEEYIGIKDIYDTEDIESLRKKVFGFKYAILTRHKKSDGDLDEDIHNLYKATRDKAKKILNDLQKKVNTTDFTGNFRMIKENARIIHALCDVTIKFMDALTEEKKRRGVFDFSDIEHYTLDIFVDEKTGALTETAMEYAKNYDEIMIDEYQDSNMLQEYILNAVSGATEGMKHMFMVGDVKQSIYRFRQARPELFVEKYDSFSENEGDNIKIELDKNFRSRKTVVDFANGVFEIIMKRDIGNI